MSGRRVAALGVLAVGWAVAAANLVDESPVADPHYVTPLVPMEAEVERIRRWGALPTRGVIGFRDDQTPNTPETQSLRTQIYLLYQSILAPVLLDRHSAYDITLVLTKARLEVERTGGKP